MAQQSTVLALAERFQLSADTLLGILRDADFELSGAEDTVDMGEVMTKPAVRDALMESKRRPSGGSGAEDQVVVKLERRSSTTLRTGGRANSRAVTVERRGQRTYAKPVEPADIEEQQAPPPHVALPPVGELPAPAPDADLDLEELRRSSVRDSLAKRTAAEKANKKAEGERSRVATASRSTAAKAATRRSPSLLPRRRTRLTPRTGEKHQADSRRSVEMALRETVEEGKGASAAPQSASSGAGVAGVLKIVDQRHHAFRRPQQPITRTLHLERGQRLSVASLARRLGVKLPLALARLEAMGVEDAEQIDTDTATMLAEDLGHRIELSDERTLASVLEKARAAEGNPVSRAAVVTVMGHVDHGKTSLLDQFRQSSVAAGEAGGITQHIGAYRVPTTDGRSITFVDTPGHEAFSAMRARGARCTDLVVLVVAADDGIMPQTHESVEHVRAAGVPLVVAINKMDLENADPERVKQGLAALEVVPDEWGGEVQFVPVSALSGDGLDQLLAAIHLQAELLELRASPDVPAWGTVIESRIDTHRGVVTTLLVQGGTLEIGSLVVCGGHSGRLRDMRDEGGAKLRTAPPSTPVEVMGLRAAPDAGETFLVVGNERQARELIALHKPSVAASAPGEDVEALFASIQEGEARELRIVLRADVQGSLEALRSGLAKLGEEVEGVELRILAAGLGGISTSDVNLAHGSDALVLGFNVRAAPAAQQQARQFGVTLNYYSIIYELTEDVQNLLVGLCPPELSEHILGVAEVREIFSAPRFGQIAGCMVVEGVVSRDQPVRVLRDDIVIFEGQLDSLRRFKEAVKEVRNGVECGIGVRDYEDVRPGDRIEVFEQREVARGVGA